MVFQRFRNWLKQSKVSHKQSHVTTPSSDHWKNFENWMTWPRQQNWKRRPILEGKYHVDVTPGRGNLDYRVYKRPKDRDNHIGRFYVRSNVHFGRPVLSVMNASVDAGHQRKGIGMAVYSMIKEDTKHTGLELWPQGPGGETSDEAKGLWRKLDPEKAKKMWG